MTTTKPFILNPVLCEEQESFGASRQFHISTRPERGKSENETNHGDATSEETPLQTTWASDLAKPVAVRVSQQGLRALL